MVVSIGRFVSITFIRRASKSVFMALPEVLLAAAVTSLAGCAGTVIVEFAVDAKLSRVDQAGHVSQARATEITTQPLPAGMSVSFPAPRYRGDVIE